MTDAHLSSVLALDHLFLSFNHPGLVSLSVSLFYISVSICGTFCVCIYIVVACTADYQSKKILNHIFI